MKRFQRLWHHQKRRDTPTVSLPHTQIPVSVLTPQELLQQWLETTDPRQARIFLTSHPELLTESVERHIENLIQQTVGNPWHDLYLRRAALLDAHRRGGTTEAILAACININGGFVLDLPEWLNEVQTQDELLRQHGQPAQMAHDRAMLWEQAEKRQKSRTGPRTRAA